MQNFCEQTLGLYVEYREFKTPGLRGMALIDSGAIALSSGFSPVRKKFYCSHELMHFFLHAGYDRPAFECYDGKAAVLQDNIIEWQANEGAAEIIIPHRPFIEVVMLEAPYIENGQDFIRLKKMLTRHFNVTSMMIKTRFDCLKFEIAQALAGVPLSDILIMSDRQQKNAGITALSMNEIFPDMFVKYPMREYRYTIAAREEAYIGTVQQ